MSLRNIPMAAGLPFSVKPAIDITDKLPSRPNDPNPMRSIEDITHVSVHHSAVEGGSPQSYANYHVNTLKWYHIGYHDVIVGDQLYQTNDLLTFAYHTSSNNHYTVGISVSGDLSKRPLSEMERNVLYARLLTYLQIFPNLTIENIWGHNEFPNNATSCPCIDMERVRSDLVTLDMKMKQESTWAAKIKKVDAIANQFNYMNSLIRKGPDDGEAQWAVNEQLKLYDLMKQQKLL